MPARDGNADDAPQCLAMLLCDGMVRDPFTKKVTLVGVMSELRIAALPATYPAVHAYASLTNLNGRYELLVTVTHGRTGRAINRDPGEKQIVTCDDPTGQLDVNVTFRNLQITEPGAYRFTLTLNGAPVASRRLLVYTLRKPPPPPPDAPA